jgi:ATP synthase protein I
MNETQSGQTDEARNRSERQSGKTTEHQMELVETVGEKAERRLAARDKEERGLWFGLGAFGVIGWSIAIPTLIGVAIGLWLDLTWPSDFSWTLALLLAGVVLGCFNAWYWVSKEQHEMEAEKRRRRK